MYWDGLLGNALTRVRVGGSIRIFGAYWQCYSLRIMKVTQMLTLCFHLGRIYHGYRLIWLHSLQLDRAWRGSMVSCKVHYSLPYLLIYVQ